MKNEQIQSWPSYSKEEAEIASSIIYSNKVNYWTGDEGKKFEEEFADWTDSKYAIAVSNGTLALELALEGLGISEGDEVIVTPRSFIASVSCIIKAGAKPIFSDINRESGNIDKQSIEKVITKKTKAIICVHLAGWPCEMSEIMDLAEDKGLFVIEDCAQAHGAKYNKRSVGSFGHISAWSFCQDKIMTTGGEGGMVTTNNKVFWEKMWSYKDHGKGYNTVFHKEHPPGFRWLHDSFGSNYRMTEIQSAIGRIQLGKMKDWTEKRRNNALFFHKLFQRYDQIIRTPLPREDITHAFYRFYVYVNEGRLKSGWDRDRIISQINSKDVPCFSGSCSEIYLEKAFDNSDLRPKKRLEVARELGNTSLCFLTHPTLTERNLDYMGKVLNEVLQDASA